ncbi:MAG: hypothetical protein Q8K60_05755 [Parachlamydiaceae bacterium]|nr:hypothetical protein [Parachlamydiaceae bacterium]
MNSIQNYHSDPTQKNYVQVLHSFKKELEKTPYSTELTNKMAEFFLDTDNHSLARYYFKRSLQINMNQPEILKKYAYVVINHLTTDETTIDKAFNSIEKENFKNAISGIRL